MDEQKKITGKIWLPPWFPLVGGGTKEPVYRAKNGVTRNEIKVFADKDILGKRFFYGTATWAGTRNASYIWLNCGILDGDSPSTDLTGPEFGLYTGQGYGVKFLKEIIPVFETTSTGGYGNSESAFGICRTGAILRLNSYKHRREEPHWELTTSGWVGVAEEELVLRGVA